MLEYPLHFRTSLGAKKFDDSKASVNLPSDNDLKGLPEYDGKSTDTLFVKNSNELPVYYGMLPDTSNFYGLIFVLKGVQGSPVVLRIFDKSGKQICEENLFCGECNALINLEWCSSAGIINNDLSISVTDTMKTVTLDNNGNVTDSTGEFYMVHKGGKINADGRILMKKEGRKNL